jgi:hypothetical protein
LLVKSEENRIKIDEEEDDDDDEICGDIDENCSIETYNSEQ